MRLKTWAAIGDALTLPFLQGCGDENAQKGFVRIINATSEYASLDLYTQASDGSDSLVVAGTTSNTASAYTGIDKGSYTFDVKSSTSGGACRTSCRNAHDAACIQRTSRTHACRTKHLAHQAAQRPSQDGLQHRAGLHRHADRRRAV